MMKTNAGKVIKGISIAILIISILTITVIIAVNASNNIYIDALLSVAIIVSVIILSIILYGIGDIADTNRQQLEQLIDMKIELLKQ